MRVMKRQTDNESQDIGSVIIAVANRPKSTQCRIDGGTMRSVGHAALIVVLASLIFMTACASYAPPAPKTIDSDAASSNKPPMVIHNSDGTFTVQKEPPKGGAENAKAKEGFVIPPQVVVPITPTPQERN